ncbi:hypothetical protein CHUAL_000232 [Chamberlinius hualienensis]
MSVKVKVENMEEDYSPDRLVDICTDFCVENVETFCDVVRLDDCEELNYVLKANISLPNEICERMLRRRHQNRQNVNSQMDDSFLMIFRDIHRLPIKRLNIRNCSQVTDEGLATILRHNLIELDVTDCGSLTEETLFNINLHGGELLSLTLGNSVHILPENLEPGVVMMIDPQNGGYDNYNYNCFGYPYKEKGHIINAPHLRRLVLKNFEEPVGKDYLQSLFTPLPLLTHLDLSGCTYLRDLKCLVHLTHLITLILYGVPRLQTAIENICKLKTLRKLDISQHSEKFGVFHKPNEVLEKIVLSLSELMSLDISGTNLDSSSSSSDNECSEKQTHTPPSPSSSCGIPALQSRQNRPLDFLGLLATTGDSCQRSNLPAIKVAGDGNEEQILAAAKAYLDRPEVLGKVLNDLFRIFRYENCRNPKLALKLILQAMQLNSSEKHIQISGSASLFYIVKEHGNLNIRMKRLIIKTLLDGMSEHKTVVTLMRNGCLTLITFRIPQDVMFEYKRLVEIVLYIVSVEDQDDFVQRIGIFLLNGLACQVDNEQKQMVGQMGIVQIMLKLINWKLERQVSDEILELSWSTMWNITDETPINCQRFLEEKGMDCFLQCLKRFPDKPELLRNMMGLLGNVAEVTQLRPMLMFPYYIDIFSDLLESSSDGIEVSYNAAGVLAHIASDGPLAWKMTHPKRKDVLTRMSKAICRWDLKAKRNINYRSFEPIFRLLSVRHTPEAQYWAVWALANLTQVYPEKYCPLVKEEGGIPLLEQLTETNSEFPIKQLANQVLHNVDTFLRLSGSPGAEHEASKEN